MLLIVGIVISVVGVLLWPLLCIGLPLLVVAFILIVAQGGGITRQASVGPPAGLYAPYPPPASPPAVPAAQPNRYCPHCGAVLLEAATFCSKCGTRVG